MNYKFERISLDEFELIYKKNDEEKKIPFKRTVKIAEMLEGITAEAKFKLADFLTKKGKTKDDLVIKKDLGNGKIIYDESNYLQLENQFIQEEQILTINKIIEKSFNMNMIKLFEELGVDATSTDPVLNKEMYLFGQKLMTVLTQPDDDTPSSEDNKQL